MSSVFEQDVPEEEAQRLVFAMCHEISNLVAAVRLHAHLIDDDLDPRGLALASIEIDDSSARSGALLALVRAVLGRPHEDGTHAQAAAIVLGLQYAIDEHGGRGVAITVQAAGGLPKVQADPQVMHYLLLTHLYGAIDSAPTGSEVRVVVEPGNGEVRFVIEDTGSADEEHLGWKKAALRGRVLSCAIADFVLKKIGGRLEVERAEKGTRTSLCVPSA
jgi:signal transduction histidine kinase